MMASKFYAIVAGIGGGTGASVARRFAKAYPVVPLARRPESYTDLMVEIKKSGGHAVDVSSDTSDPQSVAAAFNVIAKELPGQKPAAAVYNVEGGLIVKPFLDTKLGSWNLLSLATRESTIRRGICLRLPSRLVGADAEQLVGSHELFNFAPMVIPGLLEAVDESPRPPTMIITGATASMRGSVNFGTVTAGKFAVLALSQSLAREFAPQGIHVAHVVVDGVIKGPRTVAYDPHPGKPDGKIEADAIAETYFNIHDQHKSCFTQELDIRPYVERF